MRTARLQRGQTLREILIGVVVVILLIMVLWRIVVAVRNQPSHAGTQPGPEFTETGIRFGDARELIPYSEIDALEFEDSFDYEVTKMGVWGGNAVLDSKWGDVDAVLRRKDGREQRIRVWTNVRSYPFGNGGNSDEFLQREWVARSISTVVRRAPHLRYSITLKVRRVYGDYTPRSGRIVWASPYPADKPVVLTNGVDGPLMGRQDWTEFGRMAENEYREIDRDPSPEVIYSLLYRGVMRAPR